MSLDNIFLLVCRAFVVTLDSIHLLVCRHCFVRVFCVVPVASTLHTDEHHPRIPDLLDPYTVVVVLNTVDNHFLTWSLLHFWGWWDEVSMFCGQKPLTCLPLPPGFVCAHLRTSGVGTREATACQNHSWSGDQRNSHKFSSCPLGVFLVVQIHLGCFILKIYQIILRGRPPWIVNS